jgi:aminoglycoside/choline kinase family phosphotransferase/choline kinase
MKKRSRKRRFKTAFILGAGLGTRLRPMTEECPKPLLEIGGRPIITYAMDHLLAAGVDRFIVNTHHRPEVYREKFPEGSWRGVPIVFRHEPVLLDTAGGLKNIEDLLSDDEAILCYNGDVITDLPLDRLLEAHGMMKPGVTLALRSSGPLLNVNIDGDGAVCDLRHRLGRPGIRSCLFAGVYAVETSFLKGLEAGRIESVVFPLLRSITEKPGSVRGVVIDDGEWYDIGSPEEYERIRAQWPRHDRAEKPDDGVLEAFARGVLHLDRRAPLKLKLIHRGGSERDLYRASAPAGSFILMDYSPERRENTLYVSIAGFLRGIGVPVPRILAHDEDRHFILMEDLGEKDLYSQKGADTQERMALYRKTLEAVRKLHAFPLDSFPIRDVPLMDPFGSELYRWERTYFMDHCVRNVCGIELEQVELDSLEEELAALAGRLAGAERSLVHRDLQSRNVMIRGGEPVLIDFQGMRFGTPFYDLGSLLCDPYAALTDGERLDLLSHYYNLTKSPVDWKVYQAIFWDASAQRLMQALGAFGFLSLKKNLRDFLGHIPAALDNLSHAARLSGTLPRLEALSLRCRDNLSRTGNPSRR